MRLTLKVGVFFALGMLLAVPASAQFTGSHSPGDFGVASGTQPPPGFYAALYYWGYSADTVKDRNGETFTLSPSSPASVSINAYAPFFWYVSKLKFLGANYGAMIVVPWANGVVDVPLFGAEQTTSTGLSDTFIRPLDLGWHTKHADYVGGLDVYAPTGHYELGGSDNTGKGMWTYEPFIGATFYFDKKKTFSFATNAFWEFHGTKKDTDIKVGQILTLEGGLGKSFLGGGLIVGAAYYGQWKMTADTLGLDINLPGGGTITGPGLENNKNSVFALGPDLTLPIASKKKLYSLVNVRYFWEMDARSQTEGQTLVITATFPIPSVKL